MRRVVLTLAAVATLGAPAAVQAQSSASADATVSATVVAALTLIKNADLDFGPVGPSSIVAVSFMDAAAANWSATGEPNTPVTLTFSPSIILMDAALNPIVFTPDMGSDATTQGSAVAVNSGDSVSLDAGGQHQFWLGGSINVPVTPAGIYSGLFGLTVEY
ncbi:MAG: DUF4402 domain-containing protein [Gemmatimonadota bacterium]